MLLLFSLAALGVLTGASVAVYQRGAQRRLLEAQGVRQLRGERDAAQDREPETLRIGDVILEGDESWLIVGTCTYQEDGRCWRLHRLDNGAESAWFLVLRSEELLLAFLRDASDVPLFGVLGDGLTHDGQPYRLWRRGDARVEATGQRENSLLGLVRYTFYRGPAGRLLLVDESDGRRRALAGTPVLEAGLMLMPGDVAHAAAMASPSSLFDEETRDPAP